MPGLTTDQLFQPQSPDEWAATLLANAVVLNLPTTSWRDGDPEKTIFAVESFAFSYEDSVQSAVNQGNFLDFAASGTVPFYNVDGTTTIAPVSPDPSIAGQNPTSATTLLDTLANGKYNCFRIAATFAAGSEALININPTTYGPYAPGTYHVYNPTTQASYSNVFALTIPQSTEGVSVSNVTASSGLILVTTSVNHGLTTGEIVALVGVVGIPPLTLPTAWTVTVVSSTTFTLQGSVFSGAYAGGTGVVWLPTVAAFQADVIGAGSTSATPHTINGSLTSLVGVYCDNLGGFFGTNVESNASLANRCRLKLQSNAPAPPVAAYISVALNAQQLAPLLSTPMTIAQPITRVSLVVDPLSGGIILYCANANGIPSAGDVASLNAVIGAYAEGTGQSSIALACTATNVAAVLDVYLPSASNTAANVVLFQQALATYFGVAPIGGLTDPGGAYTNVIPIDAVLGACFAAAQASQVPVKQMQITLNASFGNISLSAEAVAVLSPAIATIRMHTVPS